MGDPIIAYQGEPGCNSEAAAALFCDGRPFAPLPCPTFSEALEAVVEGAAHYVALPIENSFTGSLHENLDRLVALPLTIVHECLLPVEHHLLGLRGTSVEDIRRVMSHPQALLQCRRSLRGFATEPAADTAGSARIVAEVGDPHLGALASRRAAQRYGLDVLREDMQDFSGNTTRFFILRHRGRPAHVSADPAEFERGRAKSSIAFVLRDLPGALFKALACFALRDVNLTKIESCPVTGRAWQVRFFIDVEGDARRGRIRRAMANLSEVAEDIVLLGVYRADEPRAD